MHIHSTLVFILDGVAYMDVGKVREQGAEALLLFAGGGHAATVSVHPALTALVHPCTSSSHLAYMDVGKGRKQGCGSFALNKNRRTLNTHFQASWVL